MSFLLHGYYFLEMENNFSVTSAKISGLIGSMIGLVITYLINWGISINQLRELFVAIGTASFFASFGGSIAGQMEILNRKKTDSTS